ncbi:peptidylprolyl isomerase [Fimbriimonas ginsengisoli]|uniref:peptidylprolyl isomerase n=1 Tax=Fimbriimonas ginsengisoli Gsoil 348 TaxID=661478 RepID=A0A068NSA7_FIMGI|nr:SurA N-terminal domain-containing protein [Fimbriimonas ginsengisoli]AIE86232.1 PpiC-type peptidyl-prolyl cis-trans isomerase [Fimbriimonas ginsengisoli Gsoil 348]
MKLSYLSVAAALLASGIIGCAKKEAASSSAAVATVNGEPISDQDYHDYLERMNMVFVNGGQGPQRVPTVGSVGFQGLRDIVERRIILQMAKEDGVLPTDADVTKELDERTKQQPDYATRMISQGGYTMKMLRNDILFELARENLVTKGVVVTMPEVETYIKENPKQFSEPARANLLVIALQDDAKKKQADQDLAAGQNFQTVAIRYSVDPRIKETGGAYPENVVDRMPKPLQDLVAKTAPGKATAWIHEGATWIKFFVQSKAPAKPIVMTEEKKKQVQRELKKSRGSLANDLPRRLGEKMKAAKIEVVPDHLNKPWTAMMDELKKSSPAPAGNPAGPGGAPGGPAPTGTAPAPGKATPGAKPK